MSQVKFWHSVRDYEVLRAMMTAGTTVAASQKLSVSQSTVSRALATLEERVGHTLFTRNGNRLEPTVEALRLNVSLDGLFTALGDIEGGMQAEPERQLKVATSPTLACLLIQPMITSFLRLMDVGSVSLDVCSSDVLLNGVAEERFDVGISYCDPPRAGIQVTPFRRSHIACAMPADHKLALQTVIRPEDLTQIGLVVPVKRIPLRQSTDQIFRSAGLKPKIVVETASTLVGLGFVREGVGLALLNPFPISNELPEGLVLRAFRPRLEFTTSFLSAIGATLDTRARAFIQHVKFFTFRDSWSKAI